MSPNGSMNVAAGPGDGACLEGSGGECVADDRPALPAREEEKNDEGDCDGRIATCAGPIEAAAPASPAAAAAPPQNATAAIGQQSSEPSCEGNNMPTDDPSLPVCNHENESGTPSNITKPVMAEPSLSPVAPGAVAASACTSAEGPSRYPTLGSGSRSSSNNNSNGKNKNKIRVCLLHSEKHTQILHGAMGHIHQDRDVLLSSLLHCCGFIRQTPRFFTVVEPKRASRQHLEKFHCPTYLDLLDYVAPVDSASGEIATYQSSARSAEYCRVLDTYGLTEDCHLPTDPAARALLWRYCQAVAGASLHAANLLVTDVADVAIHWGGGRHHAHSDCAGGFCYVNDAVVAIQHLIKNCKESSSSSLRQTKRVLYVDIDIHHADGVQSAFYDSDQVLTVSFHRRAPGFFPPSSGCPSEKGRSGTDGVGYNLNLPLPRQCTDEEFVGIYKHALQKMVPAYDPDTIVLVVGADGVKGDPLVGPEGWHMSPEGLAECVRLTAEYCGGKDGSDVDKTRKLLLLGAGGYDPVRTARTFLLSTAAACEAARPGMLWKQLPKDVPQHAHFARYGPEFELISSSASSVAGTSYAHVGLTKQTEGISSSYERAKMFEDARMAAEVTSLFVQSRREMTDSSCFNSNAMDVSNSEAENWAVPKKKRKAGGGGRRRKKN